MAHPDRCDSLINALRRALDAAHAAATGVVADDASVGDGAPSSDPSSLPVERLEAIITLLATAPTIGAATPPGVTKGRLAALLPPEERRHAGRIMEWLDRAGVLVEPRSEAVRWREPRPLRGEDIADLIRRVQSVAREAA
ncbi:hypothetical protein [Roseiflexus castenholzii]|jgi:hypothetical protein|uniref:Uncharacterized protein n=2 Tax=Chloroflexota TaxID=200795 RepID=A7NFI6_ROSCS|nr:hypothetical protein [Roseiflexus castenholzii]ABU56208.1 conserved hypothetical protein [Roseiflexus castenholzii DSM 13941]PJF46288.1 MAG: hypothetical protein CUN48_14555 [Candidatus Thermofonsia Clade 3 bacterium]